MKKILVFLFLLILMPSYAIAEEPSYGDLKLDDLNGGILSADNTEKGMQVDPATIDGLSETEYRRTLWRQCYNGNWWMTDRNKIDEKLCPNGRPKEPVCQPWPDCWDIRADPEGYVENAQREASDREDDQNLLLTGGALAAAGGLSSAGRKLSESLRQGDKHTIDTSTIISNSLSMSCMDWKLIGGCVWYSFPYKVSTSIKVKHYIPDYVVSAYQEEGKNPWKMMEWVDDPGDSLMESMFGFDPDGGYIGIGGDRSEKSSNIKFKNTTAIGNPLASIWNTMGLSFFLCKSGATSFVPGYVSTFDNILWRTNPIEGIMYGPLQMLTQSNLIGPRNQGVTSIDKWGYLYPRTGFVVAQDDLKAAAVTAQRTGSILTSSGGDAMLHVANRPNMRNSSGWWPPGTVEESNKSQGYWQMLLPKMESKCKLIADIGGKSETVTRATGKGDGLQDYRSTTGDYVWNFWRLYRCCSKSGDSLVFHFGN